MSPGSPADAFRDDVVRVGSLLLGATVGISVVFWASVEGVISGQWFRDTMVVFDVLVILGLGYLGLRYRQERDAR